METLNLFIRSIFIDNMVFAFFFGMCSYIAVSKSVKTALGLGLAVVESGPEDLLFPVTQRPEGGA